MLQQIQDIINYGKKKIHLEEKWNLITKDTAIHC